MSKRSDRRAAERAAHKTAKIQNPATTPHLVQPCALPAPAEQSLAAAASSNAIPVSAQFASPFTVMEDLNTSNFQPETAAAMPITPDLGACGLQPNNAAPEPSGSRLSGIKSASPSQIAANRENAKLSTGPVTPEGKLAVSQNRRSHGLLGAFGILPNERLSVFDDLVQSVHQEYNPQTDTERRLADSIVQHYWLMQRAIRLQEALLQSVAADPVTTAISTDNQKLSLFLRYQTTHERAYYKAQRELQNLRKDQQKQTHAAQIGFESQNRNQEAHEARVRLTNARAQNLEIDTACRQTMEVPLPGNGRLSFEQILHACTVGIATAVYQNQAQT